VTGGIEQERATHHDEAADAPTAEGVEGIARMPERRIPVRYGYDRLGGYVKHNDCQGSAYSKQIQPGEVLRPVVHGLFRS